MPQTLEYKDARNKNRIRHTADNGNVTYASTQGYENLTDMRQAAINAAIELLEHYELDPKQKERIVGLTSKIV